MAMPKAKPAIQWGLLIFAIFWIVHDPKTTTSIVGNVFDFISNFFHQIGQIVSFHSNT
jgi:glucose uptake protein GlcU